LCGNPVKAEAEIYSKAILSIFQLKKLKSSLKIWNLFITSS